MKKLIIICLDSFKYEYLEKTEFLRKFAEKNQYGKLQPIFGYTGITISLLTGKTPEEHGIFTSMKFSENSNLKKYGILSTFDNTSFEKSARTAINLHFNLMNFLKKKKLYKIPPCLPLNKIKYFDFSQKENFYDKNAFKFPSLFDYIRKKGIDFSYNEWPIHATSRKRKIDLFMNNDKNKVKKLLKRIKKYPITWVHLWDLDTITHKYGPDSKEVERKIKEIDETCKKIITTNKDANFLFWSDHGMVPITEIINLKKEVDLKNCLYFLDSTLARFWFNSEEKKAKVIEQLKKLPGKILTKKDMKELDVNFENKKYGDLIFLANPGVLIFPNFWNKYAPEKSMHGYIPSIGEQQGFYILTKKNGKKDMKIINLLKDLISFLE